VKDDPFRELKQEVYRLTLDMAPGAARMNPREVEHLARQAMQTILMSNEMPLTRADRAQVAQAVVERIFDEAAT
jgi:hypothetical protein